MTLLSSWRQRLARAVERGDPRLGLGLGLLLAVATAWVFAARLGFARRADDAVLDTAFALRSPIRESEKILLVDLNDQTYRELKWPIKRDKHAQVLLALDRLGARRVVFDVEFKIHATPPEEFDGETGAYLLDEEDRAFRAALGLSGKAILAYHFDVEDPIAPEVRRQFSKVCEVLTAEFTAGPETVAARAGVPADVLRREFSDVLKLAAESVVGEMLAKKPDLSFAEVRDRFFPGGTAPAHPHEFKVLHYAYWSNRAIAELRRKSSLRRWMAGTAATRRMRSIVPPLYPFLERAHSAAPANADKDPDGVLRRPWACMFFRDEPCLYLGFESGLQAYLEEGERAEVEVERRRFLARSVDAAGLTKRVVELPLDDEGRVLVNWVGNRDRRRGRSEAYFSHLAFHDLLAYYRERYLLVDDNLRRLLSATSEENGEPYHPEYGALSDRLKRILAGSVEASPDEVRGMEAEMDRHRREVLADIHDDIVKIEKRLPTITAKRIREATENLLRTRREAAAGLQAASVQEARLRPLVEGRVAWIGSTGTAGGDIHSTPLGLSTPGVDVLANVANMIVTGQSIRRAPAWVDFIYLLAVGLLVSMAVAHWSTMRSALASLALVGASVGIFAALFTGPVILVSGAGPAGTALLTFAGVTAFKELVTQRSKRKLQKELEKNTSPELVGILMEHPELLRQPRKMTGTFLFSDIKSFTSFSEKMTPEVLVPYVNRYLDRTTRSLKRHQAYLDKYIGDGIMALFGVPVASEEHARNACRAALENQALLADLNQEYEREGLPTIKTRIGVNSGDCIAGYVGAEERSDYTVLGDAVNLASRLEGANKEYSTWIMVSEFTYRLVADEFVFRELDRIRVVGKRNAVGIYELAAASGAPAPFPPGFLEAYAAALALFRGRKWNEAIDAFERALALRAGDRPSELYIGRAQLFLVNPPPPDWEGVFELSSK